MKNKVVDVMRSGTCKRPGAKPSSRWLEKCFDVLELVFVHALAFQLHTARSRPNTQRQNKFMSLENLEVLLGLHHIAVLFMVLKPFQPSGKWTGFFST